VPDDVSITGFKDLDFAAYLDPPLTTVSVSSDQIGIVAGEYLLGGIIEKPVLRVNEIQTKLILRSSTARPRSGS
jgi:LacI family transcriptional regulator